MSQQSRVLSLDQFRGYSVAGMFVVNFLGSIAAVHHVLKHNNTHFSLADSIMPSFILISGYSFRLTYLKRLLTQPESDVRWRFITRSFGLILLSLMFFGFGNKFGSYSEVTLVGLWKLFAGLVKAHAWEVLAIIGACQILLLPIVAASTSRRLLFLAGLAVSHLVLTGWFNWNFVTGQPNWLDNLLGIKGTAWDGGFFGLMSWAEIMLLGTFLPDLAERHPSRSLCWRLLLIGGVLMLGGYAASCLTRLYDKPDNTQIAVEMSSDNGATTQIGSVTLGQPETSSSISALDSTAAADSPVWPPWHRLEGRSWRSMLAEPPLVPPPSKELREPNYWAMSKRIVTQSFVFFSAGFAIFLYGVFVYLCDILGLTSGLLATFGQNPLAAYLIHHTVEKSLIPLFPRDSSWQWGTFGMLLSMAVTYLFVKFLEKRGLFLRL